MFTRTSDKTPNSDVHIKNADIHIHTHGHTHIHNHKRTLTYTDINTKGQTLIDTGSYVNTNIFIN